MNKLKKYVGVEEPIDVEQNAIDFDLNYETWLKVKVLDNVKDEEFVNVANSAAIFSQWLSIYDHAEQEGDVEEFVFSIIRKYEHSNMSFGEELKFCRHARRKNYEHFRKVVDTLIKETTDVDGLVEIYVSSFSDSDNERVLRKIRRTKASYEKWCEIRDSCKTSEKSPLKEVAINKANKYKKA